MPRFPRDRTTGLPTGDPVTPPTSICFRISIPNSVEHRSAFKGALSELGYAYNWERTVGVESTKDEEAAQLWRDRISEGYYAIDCEAIMSCAEVIECIETDLNTRQSVIDLVLASPDILQYITNNIGSTGIPIGQTNQNLLGASGCDNDKIFAQASFVIQLLHDLTEDIFEAVEVGSNTLEHAQLLASIMGLGTRALVVDTIFEFADMVVENIQEEYEGAFDVGLQDELRCGLFCNVKDACVMTLDDIMAFYRTKLEVELPSDTFELIKAVMNFYISGDFPSDAAVYAFHLLVLTLIRAGDDVLGINFVDFALRIMYAGSEGDNEWETLCEDCVETPNLKLVEFGGFAADQLEFVENVDADTSIYLVHKRFRGGYASGAVKSVGAVNWYLLDYDIVSGASWDTGPTPSNQITWGSPAGAYKISTIPCYKATQEMGLYGVDSATVDEVARITVSRNPCPVWDIDFGYGAVVSEASTRIELASVFVAGAHNLYCHIGIPGLEFHVDTATYTPLPSGASYLVDGGGNPPGYIPSNTDVTGVVAIHSVAFTVVLEGHYV